MIDTRELLQHIDLLALIGRDTRLRKVASTNGGEYAGPCPFCGGRDRLRVQPHRYRWWCRQCGGNHWSDAIAYVRKRDGKSFEEACRELSGDMVPQFKNAVMAKTNETRPPTCPPSKKWQSRARELLFECESNLWGDRGAKARVWLFDLRGLNAETLHAWHIGYNPTDAWEDPRLWGFDGGRRIYLPRGVTIPCEVGGTLWGVKIRRPQGNPKYIQPRGSVQVLFGADTLGKHDYAVLTEGEFDALLVWQALQRSNYPEWHQIGVATPGSATNSIDINTWADYLLPVSRFLVCYDADKEGMRGSEKWNALTSRARRIVVPTLKPGDKDLTDFHCSGGNILDLIVFEMARDRWQGELGVSAKTAQVAQPADQALTDLRSQRDGILAKWNQLFDQLEAMDQNTTAFDTLFAAWEQVNEEHKWLDDLFYERLEAHLRMKKDAALNTEGLSQ